MNQHRKLTVVSATALVCCFIAGCGKSSTEGAAPAGQSAAADSPSTEAIANAASDFLDAVLKGDTQRASARLTPQAMQRIIASGKPFAPPGLSAATFKIGQVRTPQVDKALVLCVITDTSTPIAPRSEEMACILRRVDNDWRVSGIAAWGVPNQSGFTTDFETGQTVPIPRDPAISGSGEPDAQPAGLPPRMATEPTAPAPR